jgi:hypothetical protein
MSARPIRTACAARAIILAVASASCLLSPTAAWADSPARERELTCSDGTGFTGEQVRHGSGNPPSAWRGITRGGDPVAFVFHAVTLTAPDGTLDEAQTWDNTLGVPGDPPVVGPRDSNDNPRIPQERRYESPPGQRTSSSTRRPGHE